MSIPDFGQTIWLGIGPEKAKIFLEDYQGDFYKLYATFHCGSEFRAYGPVSCTYIEKIGIFTELRKIILSLIDFFWSAVDITLGGV